MNLNQTSLKMVNSPVNQDGLLKPLYETYNFLNIPGTVEYLLTGETSLSTLPSDVHDDTKADTVVLLFIDALGWRFLEEVLFDSDVFSIFEKESRISKLTSMFPSTTSAHVPAINTGMGPAQTKMLEWRQYNKLLDQIISPLQGKLAYSSESLNELGIDYEDIYPKGTFYKNLKAKGVDSSLLLSEHFYDSPFNQCVSDGAERISYKTMTEAVIQIKQLLQKTSANKRYIHAYFNQIDSIAHKYGAHSDFVKREIEHIFYLINSYLVPSVSNNSKTKLIIIADHGQDEFDPEETIYLNRIIPELENMLKKNKKGEVLLPSGSSKDIFLHIEEKHIKEAYSLLSKSLSGTCDVFLSSQFIEDKMFGLEEYDDEFTEMVGDIIILPHDGESAWWYIDEKHKRKVRVNMVDYLKFKLKFRLFIYKKLGNMNKQYAFVELTFDEDTKQTFSELVKEIVPTDLLYNSPVVDFIRGDMTSVLHCTIFYGIDWNERSNKQLLEIVSNTGVESINLGKLFFFEGYQNLYRVLCVEVLDDNHELENLSQSVHQFAASEINPRAFKPHITLAYVQPDYKLPKNDISIPSEINVNTTQVSEELKLNKKVKV